MPINITESTLDIVAELRAILSFIPGRQRDTSLDQTLDASLDGDVFIIGEFRGHWGETYFGEGSLYLVGSLAGVWRKNLYILAAPIEATLSLGPASSSFLPWTSVPSRSNWVKWSAIGSLDFTIWKDNVAGERPLDWLGTVWALKWLGDKVVAYGENGISLLTPAGNAFGLHTLTEVGLRGKLAVADIGGVHYFLSRHGRLGSLAVGSPPVDLNYSEYLSNLGASTVLSWDPIDKLLYLCDGTIGFVYDPVTGSLGQGPNNITGIGTRNGERYLTAPANPSIPQFEITTDIYDFGSRHAKSLQSIEVGVDTTIALEISVEYRHSKAGTFLTTNWYLLDSRGVTYLSCYGYEFRFHLRAASAGVFRVDYLEINGTVHNH